MHKRSDDMLSRLHREGLLRQLALSNTGFVFDPRSGQSFTVNPTGLEALELLRSGLSIGQTAAALSQSYDTLPDLAETALESFIQQLGRYLS